MPYFKPDTSTEATCCWLHWAICAYDSRQKLLAQCIKTIQSNIAFRWLRHIRDRATWANTIAFSRASSSTSSDTIDEGCSGRALHTLDAHNRQPRIRVEAAEAFVFPKTKCQMRPTRPMSIVTDNFLPPKNCIFSVENDQFYCHSYHLHNISIPHPKYREFLVNHWIRKTKKNIPLPYKCLLQYGG